MSYLNKIAISGTPEELNVITRLLKSNNLFEGPSHYMTNRGKDFLCIEDGKFIYNYADNKQVAENNRYTVYPASTESAAIVALAVAQNDNILHRGELIFLNSTNTYETVNYFAGYEVERRDARKATTAEILVYFRVKTVPGEKSEKKVIGYACPFDMFTDSTIIILAGSVFKPMFRGVMYKTDSTGDTHHTRHLPKEIVEKWTPVYEEERIHIEGYDADFNEPGVVKFGCQHVTKADLTGVINFLGKGDLQAKLTVRNTPVTKELLQKLTNKIK